MDTFLQFIIQHTFITTLIYIAIGIIYYLTLIYFSNIKIKNDHLEIVYIVFWPMLGLTLLTLFITKYCTKFIKKLKE